MMKKIKQFIQWDVLIPRLQDAGVLVVYDPVRRYHELCLELATPERQVVDASLSSIESRLAALAVFQELGQSGTVIKELLVYVPARAPMSDEEKQRDPFATYAAYGAVFPSSDGDEYQSLCLRFKADQATEIRRIFHDNPNPSFDVIDVVGGKGGWPNLQALLKTESARDILIILLAPSDYQKKLLISDPTWIPEAKELLQSTLGLKLITRQGAWLAISEEFWRYLLYSEFVFDLPEDLPVALHDVPCAPLEARHLVEDLCDRLRSDRRTQTLYIERAEAIEKMLNLPAICQALQDLGVRDTFPFEERTFFSQAVQALRRDNVDQLRQMLKRHDNSVWVGRGENQAQWLLMEAAASLIQACEDQGRLLPQQISSQAQLIDFYLNSLREVDRLEREFESLAGDYFEPNPEMKDVINQARKAYRQLAGKVQGVFVKHLEKSGWPPSGRLANVDVFDKLVSPRLAESGRRVALFLIDALRYELGVELHKQLGEEGQADLQAAFAQLPSITPVGMASLLPGAGGKLKLQRKEGGFSVVYDDQTLNNVNQRMNVLRQRYGQRFADCSLSEFVRGKVETPATVELLVIRSNEMDQDFEANPEAAPGLISRTFQQIRGAIQRLRKLDFQEILVLTDHGFYLNPAAEAGDVCAKPPGNWINAHERLLMGDGSEDGGSLALPAASLGIRGDFNQAATPRGMVAYRAGLAYFHGGASLQEALVPVITLRLRPAKKKTGPLQQVKLSYKRDATRITTRLPVIEVALVGQSTMFTSEGEIELLLEAHDAKGSVVGEPKPGGPVNPATQTITLKPGETIQVTMRMSLEFEGKFTIKALDPKTLGALGPQLELETDYMV